MEFQRQTIFETLTENGWKITKLEKHELDWWAGEMWRLESVWSPVGETAFVTFLLEPESAKYVWEIMASAEKPVGRAGNQNSFSMSLKGWEKELPEFVKFLSGIRSRQNQNVGEQK